MRGYPYKRLEERLLKRATVLVLLLCFVLCPIALARESEPGPALEVQRSVSKRFVGMGGTAALVYRVENTGDVPLHDIDLTDPLCGLILALDTLGPGEYETAQVNVTVTQECESAPKAVWHCGEERFEQALEPLAIAPAVNGLQAALSVDREEALRGETALLSLQLTNTGNTALYDIELTDGSLGRLSPLPGVIAPGETVQKQIEIQIGGDSVFCITAQARTESDETVSAQSNEASVTLKESAGQIRLRISAEPVQEESARGTAKARITLTNEGGTAVENVVISERSLGQMRTLAAVAPGEMRFVLECAIEKTSEMLFLAQFAEQDGSRTTVLSEKITLVPGTAEPDAFLQGSPVQLGASAYAVFMYAGIGLLAALLLVLMAHAAVKSRRRRIAREKRAKRMKTLRQNARMDEAEWVQTRPHKPVSIRPEDEKEH